MTNRRLYKPLIVMLSLLMIFNTTAYALIAGESTMTATVSWEDKIQPYLLTKMEETTEDKIPVWLWMEDIDQDEVEQTVYEHTGLREDTLSVINEPMDDELAVSVASLSEADEATATQTQAELNAYLKRTERARELEAQRVDLYIEELRAVQKEMHREKNADTFSRLDIPQEDIILSDTQAPVYIVYVGKDDVERLAKEPKVTGIYYYDMDADMVSCGDSDVIANTIAATTVSRVRTDAGLTGSGVKVGMIDSHTVDTDDIDDSRLIAVLDSESDPGDQHSNRVAAIIAGTNGVAPQANLYWSEVENNAIDSNDMENLDTVQALVAQLDEGVHVINHSRAQTATAGQRETIVYSPLEIYLDYMVRSQKFTFVQAAGNNEDGTGWVESPSLAYNVITVGGYHNQNTEDTSDDSMYPQSSYINTNACEKPDIVADQATFNDVTHYTTGTSFAAPVVTGTVALLFQLRPSLKTEPEAVKAILMASCHRKVTKAAIEHTQETMSAGLTEHQGAGAMDPYMAVAIAGSGHYGTRTLSSTSTQETIRFDQPAYGSDGLNVSLAWSVENTSTVAGASIDLDLKLYRNDSLIKTSAKYNSSTEMVYVTPSSTNTNYTIQINRYSATGTPVRYAYAFSVSDTRYQHTAITEGVFFIKNKATGLYLTRSGTYVYQMNYSGADTQKWLLSLDTISAITTTNNRVSIGSTTTGDYKMAMTSASSGASVMFQWNQENYERDGSVTFYNGANMYALGTNNNSSANATLAAWSPYSSSNQYQKWYLEPVAYQRGDVNVDGAIQAADAQLVMQYYNGTTTPSDLQEYLADVNGDDTINASDVLLINQISVGLVD